VTVAEMVLAELAGLIAEGFEQVGERRILLRQPFFRSRQPHFQKAGAHRALAGDERGSAGSAGLLAVIVGGGIPPDARLMPNFHHERRR